MTGTGSGDTMGFLLHPQGGRVAEGLAGAAAVRQNKATKSAMKDTRIILWVLLGVGRD